MTSSKAPILEPDHEAQCAKGQCRHVSHLLETRACREKFQPFRKPRSAKSTVECQTQKTFDMYLKNSSPVHPGIPQSLKSSFTPRIHRVPLVPLDPPKNLFGSADLIIFVDDCRMRLSVLSTSQLNLTIVDAWILLIRDVPICWRAHYSQTSNVLFRIQVLEISNDSTHPPAYSVASMW